MPPVEFVKRPLGVGQFAWAMSKKDGKYRVSVGPDPLEATDDDIFFVADFKDPKKMIAVSNPGEAIQEFITLKTGEYAVLHSPSEMTSDEYPNANYSSGRNDMKPLLRGQKRIITSGYFPLWPGQSVEIRKVHSLSSNQYLMVVVESDRVDTKAPYYDITVKCAGIKKAVVDETVGSEDSEKIKIADVKETEAPQAGTKEGESGSAELSSEKDNNNVESAKRKFSPKLFSRLVRRLLFREALLRHISPPRESKLCLKVKQKEWPKMTPWLPRKIS